MPRAVWNSSSEDETLALGRTLAAGLRPPVWVGLSGPLGAGKTRLVQGIVQGLGYAGRVRSPTYILENRYSARVPILHQDLYRLGEVGDEILAGWEENVDAVILVEWAERAGEAPSRAVRIRIEPTGPEARTIRLEWADGALEDAGLPPAFRPETGESGS